VRRYCMRYARQSVRGDLQTITATSEALRKGGTVEGCPLGWER